MENSEYLLCRFGTPLEPLEEDDVPSIKRVPVEEQIVTDENGRRRFHGAFTGGFSAGFWNTVGSLEGWKPQSFKSSRNEKAQKRLVQAPTDFMDDEDLGEFGIAPQRVQARDDFASNNKVSTQKRKLENTNRRPIPGIAVLQQLLEPSREKVAVRLLRRMGWKPGQGIGARQTRKEKTCTKVRISNDLYIMKMYGCAVKATEDSSRDLSDLSDEEELTFAPDDFDPLICNIKDNTFGLGYSGLYRSWETPSHINSFGTLEIIGKNNKKLSIRGQAFGVGALEEEDDDIYAKDDMSKYDFNLENKSKPNKMKMQENVQDLAILYGFAEESSDINVNTISHHIELNSKFLPKNWSQRKTRFEPLPEDKISFIIQANYDRKIGLGRHDLRPTERGNILDAQNSKIGEIRNYNSDVSKKKAYLQHINEKYKEIEEPNKKTLQCLSSQDDNFVSGGVITNTKVEASDTQLCGSITNPNDKLLSKTTTITKPLEKSTGSFRPFANNVCKQERYEQFIKANLKQDNDIKAFLNNIQPLHLSEWHREMEQKEFIQARKIYKPLNGLMSERFVSKSIMDSSKNSQKNEDNKKVKCKVERTKITWTPSKIICKCFNIPEPLFGSVMEPKFLKKTKFSIFDYIENSINSKQDFITPVIIPKSVEEPKVIKNQVEDLTTESIIPWTTKDTPHKIIPKIDKIQAHQTFTNVFKKSKTELEIRVLESMNKHTSEKKDLFMSIFDCSSNDDDYEKTDLEKCSQNSYTDDFEKTLTKPSAPINALRNTSPPRGIFAALFSSTVAKDKVEQHANQNEFEHSGNITFKPLHIGNEKEYVSEPDCAYGPKVPINFSIKNRKFSQEDNIDEKLEKLLSKKSTKATKIVETWIEKTGQSTKKVKKSKKKKDVKKRKKTKRKYS